MKMAQSNDGPFDLLLTGGTVLNPATGLSQPLDLGVAGERIAAIASNLPRPSAKQVLDVNGCYLTPGLIDFHIHSYWGAGLRDERFGNTQPRHVPSAMACKHAVRSLGLDKLDLDDGRTRLVHACHTPARHRLQGEQRHGCGAVACGGG
jgi:imidazolonepropionase-like amidohydrolase